MALISVPISNDTSDKNSFTSRWGLTACEYNISSNSVDSGGIPTIQMTTADLQDLAVFIGKHRAVSIEGEVAPQATRIRERNARLDELGVCLSDLTNYQAGFHKDWGGNDDGSDYMPISVKDTLASLGFQCEYYTYDEDEYERDETPLFYYNNNGCSGKKRFIEGAIQRVKSEIDSLNNEAQLDMQRLQQLTDRRDEAYSATTNFMTSISDTRSNTIRNL